VPGADNSGVTQHTTTYVAARSRAHGPTVALWHAVEVHRIASDLDGACELTVCGALARVTTERGWPLTGTDVCPACVVQTR
jgi:hypothetical protein